jgi:hypothetical protein
MCGFVMCGCVGVCMCGFVMCGCVGVCMCGCFGNICTCIYCFLLFLLCIFILICYQCKDYCHRVTTQLQ